MVSLGVHQGSLQVGVGHFDQAMELIRTATGIMGSNPREWVMIP